jgi:hypothetical protein
MITVVDQARPWFTPRSTLAKTIHDQDGAHMRRKGTGIPNSHPASSTFFRPKRSPSRPAKKFVPAFTNPKVTMKERMAPRATSPNSSSAMRGRIVRSRPTIAPTKALTRTRSQNCFQFSRSPS